MAKIVKEVKRGTEQYISLKINPSDKFIWLRVQEGIHVRPASDRAFMVRKDE